MPPRSPPSPPCVPRPPAPLHQISTPTSEAPEEGAENEKSEEEMVEYEGMLVTAESAERRRLLSTTVQRAAQMSDANGGGSCSVLGVMPAQVGAYSPGGLKKATIDVSKYETLSEEQKAKLVAALEKRAQVEAAAAEQVPRGADRGVGGRRAGACVGGSGGAPRGSPSLGPRRPGGL